MRSPLRSRRILCLWLPDWPVQRLVAARPKLARCALLLTEATNRGEVVCYCNEFGKKRGVQDGMPLSEARTFFRSRDRLVVETVRPEHDRQALAELALGCARYSFCIGVEDVVCPECILMDMTGIAHFFDGEQSLADHLQRELSGRRFDGRIAIAETISSAWAAAHFLAQPRQPAVIPTGRQSLVASLPAAALRLSEATVTKLNRLGLQAIDQLLALDRAALLRRLGNETLARLDQFAGRQAEFITPCHPLPTYRVGRSLEEGIMHPECIEQFWSLLLQELLEKLRPQRLGARRVKCVFHMENRTSQSLTLRLCEATNDFRHLGNLLRFQLERLCLEASLVGLFMEALDVAPLEATQQQFFDAGTPDHVRQFSMLLNRLGSRLGEEAVVVPQLLPDPVPERAVHFFSVVDRSPPASTTFTARFRQLDRPAVLFPESRPIEVVAAMPEGHPAVLFWKGARFDIARHKGPERIESGWWQSEHVCRDYYWVETSAGQWMWVFRRRQDQRWFWHGEL